MTTDSFQGLLDRLASGTAQTLAQLAVELGVDQELLEQMLLDLERAGYVRTLQAHCEGQCRGCDLWGLCGLTHGGRIWVDTDKGLRVARTP